MSLTRRRLAGMAGTAIVVLAAVLASAPGAQASHARSTNPARIGLYGHQSPAYDGVYRQGLSILALSAANATVAPAAVHWLLRQQCDDGSWSSFRKDLTAPCGAPDSNATAMAVMALDEIGREAAATRGTEWFLANQQVGGGWEGSTGWGPDSNSTGLATQALVARGIDPSTIDNGGTPQDFLASLQLGCDAAATERGALDYQAEAPLVVNNIATAQATQGLALQALPVDPRPVSQGLPRLNCAAPTKATTKEPDQAAAGYLGRLMKANGWTVPYPGGDADYGSTANAVLSLVSAEVGSGAIDHAMGVLNGAARTYVFDDPGHTLPGAAAWVALAEHATSGNPRNVDGLNLIMLIQKSITHAG